MVGGHHYTRCIKGHSTRKVENTALEGDACQAREVATSEQAPNVLRTLLHKEVLQTVARVPLTYARKQLSNPS